MESNRIRSLSSVASPPDESRHTQHLTKAHEVGLQWQKLCEEADAARDAFSRAFGPVNQKFAAIGRGTSNVNPTVNDRGNGANP
jgi:hypothetical protein